MKKEDMNFMQCVVQKDSAKYQNIVSTSAFAKESIIYASIMYSLSKHPLEDLSRELTIKLFFKTIDFNEVDWSAEVGLFDTF